MNLGEQLLTQVATLLENAGSSVEVESNQKGIQIDLIAKESDGCKTVIECKAYNKLVGLKTIREFASSVSFLRESEPNLKAWLVTTSGFTLNAQKALTHHRIEGFTIEELRQRFRVDLRSLEKNQKSWKEKAEKSRQNQKRIFVIMPFTEQMIDVFIFGIRWAANELHFVAERADDLEHNGEIISEIRTAIEKSDAVVADTSGANPNVCYEVGYAHALGMPTVLICRKGEKLPFDLQGTNHLMYENIVNLREPLKAKIESTLNHKKRIIKQNAPNQANSADAKKPRG